VTPTQVEPEDAVTALRDALGAAGIVLPSLRLECLGSMDTSRPLVELGRARADVVMRLADVIRNGAR
jgi:hypothetical protein